MDLVQSVLSQSISFHELILCRVLPFFSKGSGKSFLNLSGLWQSVSEREATTTTATTKSLVLVVVAVVVIVIVLSLHSCTSVAEYLLS